MDIKAPNLSGPSMSNDPVLQTIDAISRANFTQVLQESEQGRASSKLVQVGDLSYKVMSDVDDLELLKSSRFNQMTDKLIKSDEQVLNEGSSQSSFDSSSSKDSSDTSLPQGVHPGVAVILKVLDSETFVSRLPSSLRSFIEETVNIIRTRDLFTQKTHYSFSFSQLNLSILLQQADGALQVSISLLDEKLKSLFNDETKGLLFNALQEAFPDEKIELSFIDETALNTQNKSGEDSSQEQGAEGKQPDVDDDDSE
jgi:hypothetical protein